MRGMRQASNRAAKTAISFQCWVQESERGTSASWTDSISTGDYTHTHTLHKTIGTLATYYIYILVYHFIHNKRLDSSMVSYVINISRSKHIYNIYV